MKKFSLVLVIALLAAGTAFAQSWGAPQQITVNGTLQLQNGSIAVATGNTVYLVPMLNGYIGFIDGLREGSNISVQGYANGNVLQPTRVTLNGRSYDFSTGPAPQAPPQTYGNAPPQAWGGYGHHGYGGYGRGGYGHHGGRW